MPKYNVLFVLTVLSFCLQRVRRLNLIISMDAKGAERTGENFSGCRGGGIFGGFFFFVVHRYFSSLFCFGGTFFPGLCKTSNTFVALERRTVASRRDKIPQSIFRRLIFLLGKLDLRSAYRYEVSPTILSLIS